MPDDLFTQSGYQPLASRQRPNDLKSFMGQYHLLADGKPLNEAIKNGLPHSMILWGPPGVGKTTLIRSLSKVIPNCKLQYEEPVTDWPLEQYYKDHDKWAFSLQIATLLSVAENE